MRININNNSLTSPEHQAIHALLFKQMLWDYHIPFTINAQTELKRELSMLVTWLDSQDVVANAFDVVTTDRQVFARIIDIKEDENFTALLLRCNTEQEIVT